MNSGAEYVASTSLTSDDMTLWENSTLLPSDEVAGAVDALRAADGGNIQVWGSSQLVRHPVSKDLVDEYRLMIEPILLA